MKHVIRLGDPTSHGGKVVSASSTTTMFGKQVALVGDAVTCPQQGHTNCTIVEGDPTWTVGGKGVALEGHKVSCGATLISTLGQVGRSYEGSGSASTGAALGSSALATAAAAAALMFNDKFRLVDQDGKPYANTKYSIHVNGAVMDGVTDEDGHTDLLASEAEAHDAEIHLEGMWN